MDGFRGAVKLGHSHISMIEKFGRFPHRNEVLGRESTPEQLEYLKDAYRY